MPQEKTESGEKLVIKIIKSKGTKVWKENANNNHEVK